MNNIKYLGKVVLIFLGVVWLGCAFSGCSHNTPLLFSILILLCVNTALLIFCLYLLIKYITGK